VYQILSKFGNFRVLTIFKMAAVRHVGIFKIFIFGHVTVIVFQMCCCVLYFTEIGWFFVEIWRLYDFQNGGCPPFRIL